MNTVVGYSNYGLSNEIYGIKNDFSFVKVGRHKRNQISKFCSMRYSLIQFRINTF